jgi:hypothetical protein
MAARKSGHARKRRGLRRSLRHEKSSPNAAAIAADESISRPNLTAALHGHKYA